MKREIIKLILEHALTCSEIARKYGVSRQYVHKLAKLSGISLMKRPKKPPYQRKNPKCPPGMKDKWRKFIAHRKNARARGIEFLLTFEQWWELWEPYYHMMGRGKMCMCRNADSGAYEVGNVRIDSAANNTREYQSIKRQQKNLEHSAL